MSGLRAARHAPSRHTATGPSRQIRPQLVRAALLPTLAAGLSGAAAVMFTLQLGGGAGERDARLWPVLAGCALLVAGALAAALLGAQRAAKAVRDRCEALRRSSVRGRQELRAAADRLERGESPPGPIRGGPNTPLPGGDPAGVDEFWLLSQELRGAREQAHTTLVRLAAPAAPTDSERTVEVFVNLARRLQSLVHREIALLDHLEDTVEDPDLLKEIFRVDHLATRIRRHAENLAVLGGATTRRQWTRPVDLSEVLRSCVAEVEQYTRVKVVPPAGGSVRGHAVADVVHLLAELVENATVFSAPDTDVVLRAERVTSGIAVEVEDRGLGMPAGEQHRMNALLGDPDRFSVRNLLADGRIGLFVVAVLARRHGIAVELKSNIYGGVLAVLVLPQDLLGAEAPDTAVWTAPPLEPAARPFPAAGIGAGAGRPGDPDRGGGPVPAAQPPPVQAPPAPAWAVEVPPVEAPPAPAWAAEAPPVQVPPASAWAVGVPPMEAPPAPAWAAEAPPVQVPPASAWAVEVPPVEAPPAPAWAAEAPPVQVPPAPAWAAEAPPVETPSAQVPDVPPPAVSLGTRPDPVPHPVPAPRSAPTAVPAPRAGGERPPLLPRRRAQEHLAPQLREAPAPRRPADPDPPLHDPGLMAAFRRGYGLAQSEDQT